MPIRKGTAEQRRKRKVPTINRYLVYSINDDGGEDESYCDLVLAGSAEDAEAWVAKARPYATLEDLTCTVEEHLERARRLVDMTAAEIQKDMDDLWADSAHYRDDEDV